MPQSTTKLVAFNESEDRMVFVLDLANTEQLEREVTQFFKSRGYRLEEGAALNGIWGSGNAILRVLFGGMVKRHKFEVTVQVSPPHTTLTLSNRISALSGGLVGNTHSAKESAAVSQGLKALFGFGPD